MRINRIVPAGLCLLAAAAMYGQTASLQQPSHNPNQTSRLGAMSFSYDAQHDQIVPNGVQLKAHPATVPIPPTTGKIVVTVNIHAESHLDKDTRFHCSLLVIGGEIDTTDGVVGGGIETANRVAKWDSCTLTVPYSWVLPPDSGASSGMILAVGVSAVDGHQDGGMVPRATLQVGGVDSLPPNGTTTSISFDIVL